MTRREHLMAMAAAGFAMPFEMQAAETATGLEAGVARRHDEGVERLLRMQVTDPAHPHAGGFIADDGLFYAGSASGMIDAFNAAFHHRLSKFHRNPLMVERLKLAARCLERSQSPDGNIDNPITNFNSPPDTAFAVLGVARAAGIARNHRHRELEAACEPFLKNAARGLAQGGVHTPNHRWVMCSAMALIHDLYPHPSLARRVDRWLAEGIDIDADGQFDERSTLVYNPITDTALVTVAANLGKWELLDAVRRNLDCTLYLTHPGDELVTEISRRQDRNQQGDIGAYWFPLHYLAARDGNPVYSYLASRYAPQRAGLSVLMQHPELLRALPAGQPPPDNYEKLFSALEVARIRRGPTSATIMLRGDSRFFLLRRGAASINAVRFASAFFGKGQFVPQTYGKSGDAYVLRQTLEGPYFQPFDPPRRVAALEWDKTRPERKRTEIGRLEQTAAIAEYAGGFRVRMQAHGTTGVPVAVEVSVRGVDGLKMDGLLRAPHVDDGFLLPTGFATLRAGEHSIRFGPGRRDNAYTQVRGAEPKLAGGSVYLTGFTPFDHTLDFECA